MLKINIMNKNICLLACLTLFSVLSFAQSNFGEIKGKIVDTKKKSPLDYAQISIYYDGILKTGAVAK
jgi:hypothetical protein